MRNLMLLFICLLLVQFGYGQRQIQLSKSFVKINIKQNKVVKYVLLAEAEKTKVGILKKVTADSFLIIDLDSIHINDIGIVGKGYGANLRVLTLLAGATDVLITSAGLTFIVEFFSWSLCDDDCDAPFWVMYPKTSNLLLYSGAFGGLTAIKALSLKKYKRRSSWNYSIIKVKNPDRFKTKKS